MNRCILPLLAALALLSCTDDTPVDPPVKPPVNPPDTTTHNWRFEVDTLGENYSGIREVIAFTKDRAWVCGDIEYEEAPGFWVRYPLAHWDGKKWTRVLVPIPGTMRGENGLTIYGLRADDIWFVGSHVHYFNGVEWADYPVESRELQGFARQMWGRASDDIYWVGNGGAFGHYDGTGFRKIPTPTDIDLLDVWGDGEKVYMVGRSQNGMRSVKLKYEEGAVSLIDTAEYPGAYQFESVWYNQKDSVLAYSGGGFDTGPTVLYTSDSIIVPSGDLSSIPACHKVRGTGFNNIWFVGSFMFMMHYNGASWRQFPDLNVYGNGKLISLSVHADFLFATGFIRLNNGKLVGVVVRGYKNQK